MKKLFTLLLALIAIAAILPEFIGNSAEQQYYLLLQHAAHPLIKVRNVSYERGWFRSRAVTAVTLNLPRFNRPQKKGVLDSFAPFRFELVHDILHGPIIWHDGKIQLAMLAATTHLRLPGKEEEQIHRIFGNKEPLTIETLRTFSGRYRSWLGTAGATYRNRHKGIAMDLQPARGDWQMDGALTAGKGAFRWPGMRLVTPQGQLRIEDASYVLDIRKYNNLLWLGANTFQIGHIGFQGSRQPEVQLTGLQFAADSEEKAGFLQIREDMALAKLTAGKESYGPAALSMRFDHLDTAVVTEFVSRQRKSVARICSSGSPEAVKKINSECTKTILALLPKLLRKDPDFEVRNLSISLPKGKVTGHAKLVIDPSRPELLAKLSTLRQALEARFRLDVPRAVLAGTRLEPRVDYWLTKGFLREKQGTISLLGRYDRGRLTINGQPFPPPPAPVR